MTFSAFSVVPTACNRCAIRSHSLCAALSPVELSALNAISRRRSYDAGQVIVTEGERDVFGNVVSGLLVEKKTLADGREQIVSLLFPGDFHGSIFDERADTSVHATTATMVCTFDRAGFETLIDGFPTLKQAMLQRTRAALADARSWMLLLGQKTAGERVSTFLLRLAQRQSELGCSHDAPGVVMDGMVLEIPITRAQIAAYLGLTIETVSRRLTALRDQRLIEISSSRALRLMDIAALRDAAGEIYDD